MSLPAIIAEMLRAILAGNYTVAIDTFAQVID